jgi:hypothetical protein
MKSLAAIMVACALALSVLACYRQRVERQRQAVAAICEAGGIVIYDSEWPEASPHPPPRFPWAREWLGQDWFDSVHGVKIRGEAAKVVPHLRELSHLHYLQVYDASFGDAELAYVTRHRDLDSVDLSASAVTDDGIARLASLPSLKYLMLRDGRFSANCLFALAGHTKLEALDLTIPDIRGSHLAVLPSLPSLRGLYLWSATIRDEDLASLEGCTELRSLRLECPSITDAGLLHLAKLPRLEKLRLSSKARITRQGYERFHEAVPDCVLQDLWFYEAQWESKETPGEEEIECDPAEGEREE